jgi:hypothetical protein
MDDAKRSFGKLIHDCTDETALKRLLANLLDELKSTNDIGTWTNPESNISRVFNCMQLNVLAQGNDASDDYVVQMIKTNITDAEELAERMSLQSAYSNKLFILMYVCGFADLSYMAAKVLDFYLSRHQGDSYENCKNFVGWEAQFYEDGRTFFTMPDFMQKYRDICFKRVKGEARDFRDEQIRKWRDAAYHQSAHAMAKVDMKPKLLPTQSSRGVHKKVSHRKPGTISVKPHGGTRKKTKKRRGRSTSSRKSKRS